MQKTHQQLDLDDRCEISTTTSNRPVSANGGSHGSLAINDGSRAKTQLWQPNVVYKPAYTQAQTWSRRWSGSRLERDGVLRGTVLSHLKAGLSPEQVSGRLKHDNAPA